MQVNRGVKLKERYVDKWRTGVLREFYVYDYLNWLLVPHGFLLRFEGHGAGRADLVEGAYSGAMDALDFAIYTADMRLVGFLDVTGYSSPRRGRVDGKRCIGSWKLWKAGLISERLGIPETMVWYAHFTDSHHILLFMNAAVLRQLVKRGVAEERRLYEDERVSYCLPIRYWHPPARFLFLLKQATGKG